MGGILLEGVTGAGKTQTLRSLMEHQSFSGLLSSGRVYFEDETFGEFMSEILQPTLPAKHHFRRLESVLGSLERDVQNVAEHGFVLERFHLSYFALMPDWNSYASFDERLTRLNCLTVLLNLPEDDLERRCIDREDRANTSWSNDIVQHFGSRPAVVGAIIQSIRRRQEAVQKSKLPVLEIDTSSQSWNKYAEQIIEAWKSQT